MAIYIYPDRIQFSTYALRLDDYGLRVTNSTSPAPNGTFTAVNIQNFAPPEQGSVAGFNGGGYPAFYGDYRMRKFPFATDSFASVPYTVLSVASHAGQSSNTHAYISGGGLYGSSSTIQKFPFATNANSSQIGNLISAINNATGHSSIVSGYVSGGGSLNTIQKFPFAADTNSTDVGDLLLQKSSASGQSSSVNGYSTAGGTPATSFSNVIEKFSFATNANSTDVGDLVQGRSSGGGHSSTVSGYTSSGVYNPTSTATTLIDKFPFATNANATTVGYLTSARFAGSSGWSSTVSGYMANGVFPPGGPVASTFDKFPFATDTNATGLGGASFVYDYGCNQD